ncbi:hypothetical protein [uncultured Draconibacterium sp.]|uniref:hypothetical protein n=1 Tax=uncultured Draconibacterium sp. TaxID=1573823 RepID=UPI002D1E40FE|nr:hypothetical protein [uncultured Draconibacterium sp.]
MGSILLLNKTFANITQNKTLSFAVSALLLVNTGLLNWSTILMSEMSYLFFSSLGFYFTVKYFEFAQKEFWKNRYFYLAIVAAVITYYIRSVGIVLTGAFIMHSLIQKKWKLGIGFVAGYSLLYLPWIIRNNIHGIKGRYMKSIMAVNPWRPEEGQLNTVGAFIEKMYTNFYDTVLKGFVDVLFPFLKLNDAGKTSIVVMGAIILLFSLWGAWRIKKYNFFLLLYLLGNMLVFLVWHPGNGSRYVWPLAPFIAYAFFHGVIELIALYPKMKRSSISKISLAILLIGFLFIPKIKDMKKKADYGYPPAYKNYFNLAKSVKQGGNKNLMICCRKPGMFHYFSETFVCNYAWSPDEQKVISGMIENKVDYVILDQLGYSSTARYLYPAIKNHGELFKNVIHLEKPDTYLLQFNRDLANQKLNEK